MLILNRNRTRRVVVDLSKKKNHWATVARWLAGAGTLLYVFSRFIPCTPASCFAPNYLAPVDVSWSQALHVAFAEHLQFGRDVVFAYGPWGFLSRGYYPATHWVAVMAWTLLSLVFWQAGRRVAGHLSGNRLLSWL